MIHESYMHAMILERAGEPLKAVKVPIPVAADGELLLKVQACGICRTDLHVVDGELKQPKLPLIFPWRMSVRTWSATASDIPPLPVWNEKPFVRKPDVSMTIAAYLAIKRPIGSVVILVVVETIFAGSPRVSTRAT